MSEYRVILSTAAIEQAESIQAWWRRNRPAAPDLFLDELNATKRLLSSVPRTGALYARSPVRGVRRLLIGRSKYHLYWEIDETAHAVWIQAIWHAERGTGPPLSPRSREVPDA